MDRNRITTIDIKSKLNSEDVFVLASQAHQVYYAPNITNPKSSWYNVLPTKSRQINEIVSSTGKNTSEDDVLQNEVSNASSSHVERVTIHDPSNFFIDLRNFEYDNSMNEDIEQNTDEDMSVDEQSDHDEEDDDDDDM